MTQTTGDKWSLEQIQRGSLMAGLGGFVLCIAGWLFDGSFFYAYLAAFLFWFGIGLGCLAIMMLHNMTGGRWGFVMRSGAGVGFSARCRCYCCCLSPSFLGFTGCTSGAMPRR